MPRNAADLTSWGTTLSVGCDGPARRVWRSSRRQYGPRPSAPMGRASTSSSPPSTAPWGAGSSTSNTATLGLSRHSMAGCACDCAVSCASATPDRDAGVVMTIGAGPMPILPRTGCSPWPQPMPRPANPLAGEPPTGEPYAGNLLVRFGGRGKRVLLPTPIAWLAPAKKLHADWWQARIFRQKEIDASIAAKAEFEYLYDKPYDDKRKVRVAGPFTVESLSPHRVLGVDENDELIDGSKEGGAEYGAKKSFPEMILENLKIAGVQQAHKEGRIAFTALTPWPGDLVCGDGRYREGEGARSVEKRAAIFIGPEFG